jgi:hypothetical protein
MRLASHRSLSIEEIDRALQTARLLRLSEGGFARDNFGNLMQTAGAAAEKLDAYAAGVLAALCANSPDYPDTFGLLVYAFAVCDVGPGLAALAKTERMLACGSDSELNAYFVLGSRTVRQMLEGSSRPPGEFARLLQAE